MNYPLISEYIDSILNAEDNFATLTNLRPVLNADGRPVMSSGNFAVVFKMEDEKGRSYAIKCFTREQDGREEAYRLIAQELEFVDSKYFLNVDYLEDELFVDTQQSSNDTFPILKMQWADGVTLDKYIESHLTNTYALQLLAYDFCRMGMWLMSKDFAHGDLKPDNILVRPDGSLALVDYDGMFVPAMEGRVASELGTPDFRHPLRTAEKFDAHIDDFSIATIALSLKAIALRPALWPEFHRSDRLLFGSDDYLSPNESRLLQRILSLSNDAELARLFGVFMLALSGQDLSLVSFRVLEVAKLEEALSTAVTKEEIDDGVEDEFGVVYSRNGKRLLKCENKELAEYRIKEGTMVVCDGAFFMNDVFFLGHCSMTSVFIPNSVMRIGNNAFRGCLSLASIAMSNSVTSIGEYAFSGCNALTSVFIPNSVTSVADSAFVNCGSISSIEVDESNPVYESKGSNAIIEKSTGKLIVGCLSSKIPESVRSIGTYAFYGCRLLRSISIPSSVKTIGVYAFEGCESINYIAFPEGTLSKFKKLLPSHLYDKFCETVKFSLY